MNKTNTFEFYWSYKDFVIRSVQGRNTLPYLELTAKCADSDARFTLAIYQWDKEGGELHFIGNRPLKEYAVQMDSDSPMKPIEEMTDTDYIRLCAEASAASGKSLTANQRELLGEGYSPLLSEIQVMNGKNQKMMLADLPKEVSATLADYSRTMLPFDYGQKKEKIAQNEKNEDLCF